MKNIKVVFFDLYNTLVYTPVDTNPYGEFFNLCGIKSAETLKQAKKIILTEDLPSFESIAIRLGVSLGSNVQKLTKRMNQEISDTKIFAETKMVLSEIKNLGIGLCVISNLATPYKKPVFDLGINNLCDKIIFSCEKGCKKPDKEIYHLACREMQIQPTQGLMIGDSVVSDYWGALNAGLNAVLLNRDSKRINIPNFLSLTDLLLIIS